MQIAAELVVSAARPDDFPRDGLFEIALVGRSNVGKSTLINALVGRRLARTSAAPGKTRLINFYRVGDGGSALYLADLPGYGYARGGVSARRDFDALTREYFSRRREPRDTARDAGGRVSPNHALLLVDARHPGLAPDRLARQWLAELSVSTTVVATKIDKLTRAERRRAYGALEAAFHASFVAVSPATGEGLKELWTLMLALPRPA